MIAISRLLPISCALAGLPASALIFSEPLALKVGWDTQALFLGDVDGDGREDMAIIDNARARIVFHYGLKEGESADSQEISTQKDKWEPLLENAPFNKRWLTTGVTAYDLLMADLNGDEKLDLVYSTDRNRVQIHFQEKDRTWSKPQSLKLKSLKNNWTTLVAGDLDQDGDQDLAILGEESIAVVKNEGGKFSKPAHFECGASTYNLQLTDVNGDKKLDLAYQDPDGDELYVRLQQDGEFLVEQVLGVKSPRTMVRFPSSGDKGSVISLSDQTAALEKYAIAPGENHLEQAEIGMFSYTLGDTQADALYHLRVDLDQDGRDDLIVADSNSAELRSYKMLDSGRFSKPTISATARGIKSLGAGDLIPGGRMEVVVYSEDENLIGVSTIAEDGSFPFPSQIALEEKPVAFSTDDIDGNGQAEIVYLSENSLHTLRYVEGKWTASNTEMGGIGAGRVQAVKLFDIDQDGRPDLLVHLSRGASRIYLQQADGTFEAAPKQSGFAEKLTDRVPLKGISYGDIDQDGNAEMIVCRDTFARALRLDVEGQLEVVRQINLKKKKISLQSAAVVNLLGDAAPEIVFYEKKKGTLEITDLLGESLASIELYISDFTALEASAESIIVYGAGQILQIPLGNKLIQASQVSSYQTSLKEMNYMDFRIGDLNTDGQLDAVVVDSRGSHVMEILLGTADGWESQQYFTLFEADRHYRGKRGSEYQPRDFQLHDVNGDGKPDLVLLIHDRILTYLQQ